MILAKRELLKEIKLKNIKITPFDASAIGPCSIDLQLGNVFLRFKKNTKNVIVKEKPDYKEHYSSLITLKKNETFTVEPGELVLGITKEKLSLASSLCGWIEGRSRFARMGLMVHISAGLIQPGVNNVQVLEIVNLSPAPLVVKPGLRVCQVVFERLSSPAHYEGPFKHQTKP